MCPNHIILRIKKNWKANSEDPGELVHYEPPHLDLHCLQNYLHIFSLYGYLNVNFFLSLTGSRDTLLGYEKSRADSVFINTQSRN